jgi:hypothetical protein
MYTLIGLSQPRRLSTDIDRVRGTNMEQLGNRADLVAGDLKGSRCNSAFISMGTSLS